MNRSAALDPVNTQMVRDLLIEERRRGVTIVMSTHQMHQVEELCDRLILINQGNVLLYGSLEAICQRYEARAVLVRSRNALPEVIDGTAGRERLNGVTRLNSRLAPRPRMC